MTLPDLSVGQALVESVMIDRAKVLDDPQGPLDDTVNPDTGLSTPPANDVTTVHEGPCLAGKVNRQDRSGEGGQIVSRRVWRVRWPLSAPRFYPGQVIEFVASADPRSNPALVGLRVRIDEVDQRSLVVDRIVFGSDEAGAPTGE